MQEDKNKTVDLESEVKTEIKTQVTSIAQEEARTGQKIPIPSAEELVQRASLSMIRTLQQIEAILSVKDSPRKMSNRAIKRAILAGLQLPTDGMPINLRKDEEKLLFGLIQRVISDRFIILQHHITQQMKIARAKEEDDKQKEIQKEGSNE